MKIVFVYPDILKGANWTGYFYTGIGYLAAVTKSEGHEASLIHITRPTNRIDFMHRIEKEITEEDETIFAFSTTTNMFGFVREWTRWIKSKYDNKIIIGGVHPTLNPEDAIGTEGVDSICIGEGEAPLVEFLKALQNGRDLSGIQNLWIKDKGRIHKNPLRHRINDLNTLPFPDREIYDYKNLDREREGFSVLMASRGCPYNCSYCCNHAIRSCTGDTNGYLRFRSVDNIILEIKQIIKDYSFIKKIHFDDDILPIKRAWFEEFSDKYSKEVGLPFECNVRPNLVDEEAIGLLYSAGCETIRFGIESGNSYIRNKILNRGLSEDDIIRASFLCKKAGIKLYTFNMVGIPLEDMSARLDTIKINARVDSDEEQVSIYYPYEGTKLFDLCNEIGLYRKNEVADPFKDTSLSFSRIERNQIIFTAYYFTILVRIYKKYLKLPQVLSKTMIELTDFFLKCKFTAMTIYPPMIILLRFLSRHKKLEEWSRKIKKKILSTSRGRIE